MYSSEANDALWNLLFFATDPLDRRTGIACLGQRHTVGRQPADALSGTTAPLAHDRQRLQRG
jgi:hypothetical protein